MRRFLTILLMAVLATAPRIGMNANQAIVAVHVDHVPTDADHAHAQENAHHDRRNHNNPIDCWIGCGPVSALAANSLKFDKVVQTFSNFSIVYYLQLASDYWITYHGIAKEVPHWASAANMPLSISILERTMRLRN